jgi:hypothetical protein
MKKYIAWNNRCCWSVRLLSMLADFINIFENVIFVLSIGTVCVYVSTQIRIYNLQHGIKLKQRRTRV